MTRLPLTKQALTRFKRAWLVLFCPHTDQGYHKITYTKDLNTLKVVTKCRRCGEKGAINMGNFRLIYKCQIKPQMEKEKDIEL